MSEKQTGFDKDLIREMAALLKETDLSEIEVENAGFRVRVCRNLVSVAGPAFHMAAQSHAGPSQGGSEADQSKPSLADPARHPGSVPSPMVGTAYRAPEPGSPPFVEVGQSVRAGQTILILEAMKHMNEVVAPRAGTVVAVFVEDGQPVEYGEPLMIIE